MAEKTALPTVPLLTGDNYFNWRVKMESVLQLKRLVHVLSSNQPTWDNKKKEMDEWDEKNADAVAYIRLSLSDGQLLQFANETNARLLELCGKRFMMPMLDPLKTEPSTPEKI